MGGYAEMDRDALIAEQAELRETLDRMKARGLKLNMARGKPAADQLALSLSMLDLVRSDTPLSAEDGTDCRNYGCMDGIPEAKRFMGEMMGHDPAEVLVFGNSSLNIMHDLITIGYVHGWSDAAPWKDVPDAKWLCVVPGYDRHFSIVENFGFELLNVPMTPTGPDMSLVERLVAEDAGIKGIWCVPQYSNPDGVTYSDETVQRLASMDCAAADFRIFWDNAYCVHDLYDDGDRVADIAAACNAAGNPDRYFMFASTSKVTLPGAGIAAVAASAANLDRIKRFVGLQTVGYDKLNQLRHVRFLRDAQGLAEHMRAHAAILRPKFDLVQRRLEAELSDTGCATWSRPRGGYFISFDGLPHTAKRTVELAAEAGVVMTGAGATYPRGIDPDDRNIRIAPTLPPVDELDAALEVFCVCVKLAAIEVLSAR